MIFLCFVLRFSLPGPMLALENHGFAKGNPWKIIENS